MENVSKIKINVLQKNIYKIRLVFSVFGQGFLQLPRCYLRNGKEIAQLILKKNWMCERKDDLYKECKPGVPIHSNGQVLKVMVKRALEADEVEETPCQRPKAEEIMYVFFIWKKKIVIDFIQSTLVSPELLLSVYLLFGQNLFTPELFIIPIHVSVRKK